MVTCSSSLSAQTGSSKSAGQQAREQLAATMKARMQEREAAAQKRIQYRDSLFQIRLKTRDSLMKARNHEKDSIALVRKLRRDSMTYTFKMKEGISKLELAKTTEEFKRASETFKEIGMKERMRWMPYYYEAFSQLKRVQKALLDKDNKTAREAIISADETLKVLRKRYGDNIETLLLEKLMYQLRWNVNGKTSYSPGGAPALALWSDAYAIDAKNPRVLVLKGQDLIYGPNPFNGDKERGIAYLKDALKYFDKYKPVFNVQKDDLEFYPNWGKDLAEGILKKEGASK